MLIRIRNGADRVNLACAMLATLLPAVPFFPQGTAPVVQRAADEADIREVVIRRQMEAWYRDADKGVAEAKDKTEKPVANSLNFKVFFVSINGKDPTDDFLKRLQDVPRIIKKRSRSEVTEGSVRDKHTHQLGIIFRADAIRWLGNDSVRVEGGYYCGALCGAGMTYELYRKNGKWTLIKEGMTWIS